MPNAIKFLTCQIVAQNSLTAVFWNGDKVMVVCCRKVKVNMVMFDFSETCSVIFHEPKITSSKKGYNTRNRCLALVLTALQWQNPEGVVGRRAGDLMLETTLLPQSWVPCWDTWPSTPGWRSQRVPGKLSWPSCRSCSHCCKSFWGPEP